MLFLTLLAVGAGTCVQLARRQPLLALPSLRFGWLAVGGWLLQVAVFAPTWRMPTDWMTPVYTASLVCVIAFLAANPRMPGAMLLGVGTLLNLAVVAANGGSMPVSGAALTAVGHAAELESMRLGAHVQKTFLMQSSTPLWPLGDVLPLPLAGKVYSVGDLVLALGGFVFVAGRKTKEGAHET